MLLTMRHCPPSRSRLTQSVNRSPSKGQSTVALAWSPIRPMPKVPHATGPFRAVGGVPGNPRAPLTKTGTGIHWIEAREFGSTPLVHQLN